VQLIAFHVQLETGSTPAMKCNLAPISDFKAEHDQGDMCEVAAHYAVLSGMTQCGSVICRPQSIYAICVTFCSLRGFNCSHRFACHSSFQCLRSLQLSYPPLQRPCGPFGGPWLLCPGAGLCSVSIHREFVFVTLFQLLVSW